tara:strand:+ start:196 stop:435 length:240 start_codon:yes stop_codon:yes gene_type:complete
MSAYGKKVVAVIDTQSTFGATIKQLSDDVQNLKNLQAGQFGASVTEPQNPSEGQLWFDKNILKMKIYISDGNSSQWVEV